MARQRRRSSTATGRHRDGTISTVRLFFFFSLLSPSSFFASAHTLLFSLSLSLSLSLPLSLSADVKQVCPVLFSLSTVAPFAISVHQSVLSVTSLTLVLPLMCSNLSYGKRQPVLHTTARCILVPSFTITQQLHPLTLELSLFPQAVNHKGNIQSSINRAVERSLLNDASLRQSKR